MNDLLIIGAGGFGREVAWLIERINCLQRTWNLVGFLDDDKSLHGTFLNGIRVIGDMSYVANYKEAFFVCAVGDSTTRERIVKKAKEISPDVRFATLIDPSVLMSDIVSIDEGSIICAGSILTVNLHIGKHVIINLDCTIGHDALLSDFVTVYPSVNISGSTSIEECSEIGTGTQIIQGKRIGSRSIVGAGSVVVKDIPKDCTAVGCPARPIKFHQGIGNDD